MLVVSHVFISVVVPVLAHVVVNGSGSMVPVVFLLNANNHNSDDKKLQRFPSSTTQVRSFVCHSVPSAEAYTFKVSPIFMSEEFIWYAISNFTLPLRCSVIPFAPAAKLSTMTAVFGIHNSPHVACLSSVMCVGGLIMPYRSHHATII